MLQTRVTQAQGLVSLISTRGATGPPGLSEGSSHHGEELLQVQVHRRGLCRSWRSLSSPASSPWSFSTRLRSATDGPNTASDHLPSLHRRSLHLTGGCRRTWYLRDTRSSWSLSSTPRSLRWWTSPVPTRPALFTGNSTVYLKCVKTTSSIYLHSRDAGSFWLGGEEQRQPEREDRFLRGESWELGFMEIQLDVSLEAGGNYSLFLNFKGQAIGNIDGLFLSTYLEGVPEYEGDMNPVR